MKHFNTLLAACFLLFSLSVPSQGQGSFRITLTSIDQPDGNSVIDYFFKEHLVAMHITPEATKKSTLQIKSILNLKDESTIILRDENNGKKTGMKINNNANAMMFNRAVPEDKVTITPTNEAKVIDGYNCKKYIVVGNDFTSEHWMSEEVKVDYKEVVKALGMNKRMGNRMMTYAKYDNLLNGFPIEINITDKKGRKSQLRYSNISTTILDEKVFSTEGYQIQEMPMNPMMMQEQR